MRFLCFILCTSSMLFAQGEKDKAFTLINQQDYLKAEHILSTYLVDHQNDTEAIELLGDAYAYQEQWDKAIIQYKTLVEQQSSNANLHYKYGGVLGKKVQQSSKFRALGLLGKIKSELKQAAALDKTHIEARWALVDLYVSLPGIAGGSYSKALKYAEELAHISKLDGYLAKGYIYEYDDEKELAEINYKKAANLSKTIDCTNPSLRNALRYQLSKLSADYRFNLDKGITCITNYMTHLTAKDGVPKEWAYYRLAQIYKHKKSKNEALTSINKALSIRSDFKQALKEKTEILKLQ